jgi:ADP-ribose pyrophosphatase YjhB (NUDIX family)
MQPWIMWARRLQATAQTGLTYAKDQYDVERYEEMRELAAEIASYGAEADIVKVRELFAHDAGYTTPKVDVRAAVFRDGEILLVRERSDGLWTLPGGWADPGDSPAEAVEREVREESGFEARATRLLMVLDRDRHGHPAFPFSVYRMFFRCELTGGAAKTSYETTDVGFFAENAIPDLSLMRVTPALIDRLFEQARHPERPTEFD